MEPPPPSPPIRERVFYRDRDEFNAALDAASDAIRRRSGPDLVGSAVWWGLLAVLANLVVADWVFDWDLRRSLVPGVDLVKPVGLAVVAMLLYHHAWTRNRHGRILRDRLCLACGTPLAEVAVDAAGDGACPQCGRAFNLGEYRRPEENRGRDFHGYLDADHFDKAMYAAAEQVRAARGFGLESDLIGWLWVGLGASYLVKIVLDVDLFDWVPGPVPWHFAWLAALGIWTAWHAHRVARVKPSIVAQRRCMTCGFCLLHTAVDAEGIGRCPECGAPFALGQYAAPASPPEAHEDDGDRAPVPAPAQTGT